MATLIIEFISRRFIYLDYQLRLIPNHGPAEKKLGSKPQLDERTQKRRRAERRRAADRLQHARENPHARGVEARRVITSVSLVLIIAFAYLLRRFFQ